MSDVITLVAAGGAKARHSLGMLAGASGRDRARAETIRWIKSLRLVNYGGATMRERFTYRGDSLWWFTELYLQKMRRLDAALLTIAALEAAASDHAARVIVDVADPAVRAAAKAFGDRRRVAIEIAGQALDDRRRRRWEARMVGVSATLSRLRAAARRPPHAAVAAFVHTAFWNPSATGDGPQQERYIGRTLEAVAARLPAGDLVCVGVGPRRTFRARKWWDPVVGTGADRPAIIPIERLAGRRGLAGALDLWRRRDALAAAVIDGSGIRDAAIVDGYDLWPVLERELADAARIQWPWSARAMDEAGAALDALAPSAVVTYAEAGGWGRALVLEARRRGVRSIGLQHGFIYRHWLNYRHEADEMTASGDDRGFPAPDRTLVFDRYAAAHLESAGHFRPESLAVTGSPTLDALVARMPADAHAARADILRSIGAPADSVILVLAAKFSEIRSELPAFFAAVGARSGVRLVVKPHPADAAGAYASAAAGHPNIIELPADADLARLLSAAAGLVTMNSTVAIDALVLGLPTLVLGLPNNLTPFVEAGVMLGAGDDPGPALDQLLHDERARAALAARAAEFTRDYEIRADGRAAERAADAILAAAGRASAAANRG